MALDLITDQDIDNGIEALSSAGFAGTELEDATVDYIKNLREARTKRLSPPSFGESAKVSAIDLLSSGVRGISAVTPESVDPLLESAANRISDFNTDDQRARVAGAAGGNLVGEGALETWKSLVGQHLPLTGTTLAAGAAGAKGGALIGGAVAGPVGAGVGGAIGGVAAPLLTLSSIEAGSFLQQAEDAGIDKDIAEDLGRHVAVINGAIEEAQQVLQVGPLKGALKGVARKAMHPALKILKEIGISGLEGLEEIGQGAVVNRSLASGVKRMQDRYGTSWTPNIQIEEEDLKRAGIVGAGLAAITRGGGRVVGKAVRPLRNAIHISAQTRKLINELRTQEDLDDLLSTDIDQSDLPKGSTEPFIGFKDLRSRIPGSTDIRRSNAVERMDKRQLLNVLKNSKMATPESARSSLTDLRAQVLGLLGEIQEGPRYIRADTPLVDEIPTHLRNLIPKSRLPFVLDIVLPTTDKVTPEDAQWGSALESSISIALTEAQSQESKLKKRLTKRASKDGVSIDISKAKWKFSGDGAVKALWNMRKQALVHAGLSEEMAVHPELNDISRVRLNGKDQGLASKLTREQYVKYTDALEANVKSLLSAEYGRKAISSFDATVYARYLPDTITDDKGNSTEVPIPKDIPVTSLIASNLRPLLPLMSQLQNRMFIRTLNMHHALTTRHDLRQSKRGAIAKQWEDSMSGVDRRIRKSRSRKYFNDLVAYVSVGEKGGKVSREQMDLRAQFSKRTGDAAVEDPIVLKKGDSFVVKMAERVLNGMKPRSAIGEKAGQVRERVGGAVRKALRQTDTSPPTVEDVINQAVEVSVKRGDIRNWLFRQSNMDESLFRQHYVPLLREFLDQKGRKFNDLLESSKRSDVSPWEKFMEDKRDTLLSSVGLTDDMVDKIVDMGDVVASLKRKGIVVDKGTPFFEFSRTEDLSRMRELDARRRTDVEAIDDIYTSMMLDKIYFEDMAPSIQAFMTRLEKELKQIAIKSNDKNKLRGVEESVKKTMIGYFDSIFHVPTTQDKLLMDNKVVSDTTIVGRSLGRLVDWHNENLGHIKPELNEDFTYKDVASMFGTSWYATSLGLPFNFIAPLKNIATQNLMAGITGMRTYVEGVDRFITDKNWTKDVVAAIDEFRAEFKPTGQEGGKNFVSKLSEMMLYFYRYSDRANVASSISTAWVSWERLEGLLKQDPKLKNVTMSELGKILFEEKMPSQLGLNDTEVMERNTPWMDDYQYEGKRPFRGITQEVFDLIRNGNAKDAKRMYTQYIVNLSQWRYGAGGTPIFARGAVSRLMWMFTSWPLNATEYLAMATNPKNKMVMNYLRVLSSQMVVMAALALVGLPTNRWIMFAPEDLGFTGPFADLVRSIYRTIVGTAEAGAATVLPVSAEERRGAIKRMNQRWKSLTE